MIDPPEDTDEDLLDDIWAAAQRSESIAAWSPPAFQLRSGELTDIVVSNLCEMWLYSDALRIAVESQREPQDDHTWLPVPVRTASGGSAEQYWLLHPGGAVTKDVWGIVPERVAERAVVRLGGGDSSLGFADRLRVPIEEACPAVVFKSA